MRFRSLAIATTLAASTALLATPASADIGPSSLSLASVAPDGAAVGNDNAYVSLVSADGSTSTFVDESTNLVDGFVDGNGGAPDTFVRDLATGTTELVSRAVGTTTTSGDAGSQVYDISADGRYLVLQSSATDLVSGFTTSDPTLAHIFLFDRETATMTLVDHAAGIASAAANDESWSPLISADGSTVTYVSLATDLVAGASVSAEQTYAYEVATGTTTLISHAFDTPLIGGNSSTGPYSISADGRVITLVSGADNLVASQSASGFPQVFAAIDGTIRLVSGADASASVPGNNESTIPYVSDNGSTIVFSSDATDLVAGVTDANGNRDAYSYDIATATLTLVSHTASDDMTTANGFSEATGVSALGNRASVYGNATNLVADFVNNNGGGNDAYVAHLDTGTMQLISRGSGPGNQGGDGATDAEVITRDGSAVVLRTFAGNFGWTTNGSAQGALAFVETGQISLLTVAAGGGPANNSMQFITSGLGIDANMASSTGAVVAFTSSSTNLAVPQTVASGDHAYTADVPVRTGQGYWLIARDGGVFSFGDAAFYGSTGDLTLNQPIVGGSSTPSGDGYWFVASDGGIFSFGDAQFSGSTGALTLNQPIVGMIPVPYSNSSYWLVARDGGIFSFGPDAEFFGSTGALTLNQPIVGGVPTPSGNGYWFVAADGGIFSFGDAAFHGSTGALTLNQPIVAMAATPSGNGYWLIARDGGVFSFGDAAFYGSTGAVTLNQPIVGGAATPTGAGYWFVAADGGVFSFGDARFHGSTGAMKLNQPIVGMAIS